MRKQKKKQNFSISQALTTFLTVGMFCYFSYHLIHGEQGYFALKGLEKKVATAEKIFQEKQNARIALENRVIRLRPDSLDLDVLDERTRVVLGFVHADEKVIILKN